jgi:hypothetical protein
LPLGPCSPLVFHRFKICLSQLTKVLGQKIPHTGDTNSLDRCG